MNLHELTGGYPITKMHGCGNDFVVLMDKSGTFDHNGDKVREYVISICDRHFGVGADGLIAVVPSRIDAAQHRMKYFNSNGSVAEMCGNGIRCLAKYIVDNESVVQAPGNLSIDTDAGLINLTVLKNTPPEAYVRVNMGVPEFWNSDQVAAEPGHDGVTRVESNGVELVFVGMGNPHAIAFTGEPRRMVLELGPLIETDADTFPQGTNVEFATVDSPDRITMNVWERGVGETLACGTGACATFVAAVLEGKAERQANVILAGGELVIRWDGRGLPVFLEGPARNVFNIDPETLESYLFSK